MLGNIPQVILALGSLLFPLFISFIITELQLGGVINLLVSSCQSKAKRKNKKENIKAMFLPNIHSVHLHIIHHPSVQ